MLLFGNAGVLASLRDSGNGPGLLGKVPKMLMDPIGPLYLRWQYFPKIIPRLLDYPSNCNQNARATSPNILPA